MGVRVRWGLGVDKWDLGGARWGRSRGQVVLVVLDRDEVEYNI